MDEEAVARPVTTTGSAGPKSKPVICGHTNGYLSVELLHLWL